MCDQDEDGCADFECFEGVECIDNPPPASGASCGPCPNGSSSVNDTELCIGGLTVRALSLKCLKTVSQILTSARRTRQAASKCVRICRCSVSRAAAEVDLC